MGKLRFTLTIPLIWIVLILSCLLSENFNVFDTNPLKGLPIDSAFILTISTIALLVIYYFVEHKRNGLKFDKILLPSFLVAGLLLIMNIFRQGDNSIVPLSFQDRLLAALEVVVWLGVIYAIVFVYNRFRLVKESDRWVAKLFLIIVLGMMVVDIFVEGKDIIAIFNGTYDKAGLAFCMGNANVWSLLLFSGILSVMILSYKRFRWQYYVAMVVLTVFNIFTTCSTTMYITFISVFAYTIFEIVSHFRANKNQRRKILLIYVGAVIASIGLLALLIAVKVPFIYNAWNFISNSMFNKEFGTLSSRTDIWYRVIELTRDNPLNTIFGLGHQTGSLIFQTYMDHAFKSAHNAYMEIFLRYGLLGLSIYLGVIGLTIYCLIKHIKQKKYRFAFFYGLCFLCILAHGITESTTLFTPNIGGLFFGLVFVLPVINIVQEKHFNEIKQDLLTVEGSFEWIKPKTMTIMSIYVLATFIISYCIMLICKLSYYILIAMMLGFLAIGVVIVYLVALKIKYNPIEKLSDDVLFLLRNSVREGE